MGDPTNNNALYVDSTVSLIIAPTGINGGPVTVGTTAVELTFTGTTKSVFFQSDHDNDGILWWGDSNVDNTGANAHGRLSPGQSHAMDLNDAAAPVYVVSDTATQKVFKNALT